MNGNNGRVTEAQLRRELLRINGQKSRRRMRIGVLAVLAVALLIGALAAKFLFQMADIRTNAMAGTLKSGDVVLCEKLTSPLPHGDVARGALALVRYSENGLQRQAVRRVIAMAGDEVTVESDGHVAVNGEALEETYVAYRAGIDWTEREVTPGGALENPFATEEEAAQAVVETDDAPERVDDMDYPLTVPEGRVFVLCDDREDLLDSRSSRFGMVKDADLLAVVREVIWPVHRAGMLLIRDKFKK